MSIPNASEKSNDLDRQENLTKGNVSAKKVAIYQYNSSTDTLEPGLTEKDYATRIDDQTPILYVGKAPVGSATSAAVWQISKVDTSAISETWAGSAQFNQIWDNRGSLTYE